jgi:site-specific DNA-methyltransferase (adenine-specific)
MRYNTIYEGDCILGLKKLPDKSVDITFTSPPYNRLRDDKYSEYSDKIEDYLSFLKTFTDECLRVSRKLVIINIQKNFYNKKDVFKFIGEYSENIQEIVIWEKTNPMPAAGKSITNSYEFFIMMANNPIKANSTYTKNIIATSVNGDMVKDHKAIMKQDVSDWFIQTFTDEKDIILDCFMGLGTTAASSIKYGRKWIGFEISPKYNEMAIKRLSQGNLSGFFGTQANSASSSFNKDLTGNSNEFPKILPLAELR